MATPIRMPDFGTNVEEVRLVAWLKKVGQRVVKGEGLCEVETDKATVELESVADGVLLAQAVPAGAGVQEGTVIAYIGRSGRKSAAGYSDSCTVGNDAVGDAGEGSRRAAGRGDGRRNQGLPHDPQSRPARGRGPCERARHRAWRANHAQDVLRVKQGGAAKVRRLQRWSRRAEKSSALSANQRVVARRVSQSHSQIVPIDIVGRINMTAALALRERLAAQGQKVSFDAIVVRAFSQVLVKFEQFRQSMAGEEVLAAGSVNVGFAVSAGKDCTRRRSSTPTASHLWRSTARFASLRKRLAREN